MFYINTVTVSGKAYNIRYENGILKFGLSVIHSRKNGDTWENEYKFINVTAFGKLGELHQKLQDRQEVVVQGRIDVNEWQAQDGTNRKDVGIVANAIHYDDRNGPSSMGGSAQNNSKESTSDIDFSELVDDGESTPF